MADARSREKGHLGSPGHSPARWPRQSSRLFSTSTASWRMVISCRRLCWAAASSWRAFSLAARSAANLVLIASAASP